MQNLIHATFPLTNQILVSIFGIICSAFDEN